MKKNILLFCAVATLFSCKKTEQIDTLLDTTVVDSNIIVSALSVSQGTSINKGSKTYSFLGWGYDITGRFADSSSVRAQAVDVEAFIANNSNRYDISKASSSGALIANARDAEELAFIISSRIALTTGQKQFKGEITDYFINTPLSPKYIYGDYILRIERSRLLLNASPQLLTKYITADFKNDIASLSASDLVKKYGTHVLQTVVLGAKFKAAYQAESSDKDRKAASTEGLRYAMVRTFGLFSGSLDKPDNILLSTVRNPVITYNSVGGNSSKIKVSTKGNSPKIDIMEWVSDLSYDNQGFIDFTDNGLVPLDSLIDNEVKKEEVGNYIKTYLENNTVRLIN